MCLLEKTSLALEKGSMKTFASAKEDISCKGTYTERFLSSLIALISIFLLPIASAPRTFLVFDATLLSVVILVCCWIATVFARRKGNHYTINWLMEYVIQE
jgi:hypothetical protein